MRHCFLWASVMMGVLAFGCSAKDKDAEVDSVDPHAEAIPDTQVFALRGDEATPSSGTTQTNSVSSALVGQKSDIQQHVESVRDGIENLLHGTLQGVNMLVTVVPAKDINDRCKMWQIDDTPKGIGYQLFSCEEDRVAKRYAFLLRARKLSGGVYLPIFAGRGAILPRFENLRRGHGWVAYDFDNMKTVGGAGSSNIGGKLGIGYRAAGRVRTLHLGFKDFLADNATEPVTALYRFTHVVGKRAAFHMVSKGDYFATTAEKKLVSGQDGKQDVMRIVAVWNKQRAARAAIAICGDTVSGLTGGSLACVAMRQCWGPDGIVTFEEPPPNGSWASCAPVDGADESLAAPGETDVAPPQGEDSVASPNGEGAGVSAPRIAEPAPSPEE